MSVLLGIVGLLIQAAVIGLIVWLIVSALRRSETGPERGTVGLRRFLQYSFLLGALLMAANGLSRLLMAAIPTGAMADRRVVDLSLGLSLTLVALPAWLLLWRAVSRKLDADPDERAGAGWALYLVLAQSVTLIVAYVQLVMVGRWLVGIDAYEPAAVAYGAVWLGLWAGHAWMQRQPRFEPAGWPAPLAVLIGAGVGLAGLATGGVMALSYGLDQFYRAVTGTVVVAGVETEQLWTGLVVGGLGALIWWWHWWRQGLAAPRTGLRQAYLLLVAILGGLVTALVAGGIGLHLVLQWLVGEPAAPRAVTHFADLPVPVAAAAVGGGVWWYHRAVVSAQPTAPRGETDRIYSYLVSAIGLLTAATGVAVALVAALQAVIPGALAAADPRGRNTLAVALTLIILGGPVWGPTWRRLQQRADIESSEVRSATRRAYLFVLFGVAGLAGVISLSVILFQTLRDLFEGQIALTLLYDLRAAIAIFITTAAVSAYHWAVHRDDRRAVQPVVETPHPRSVLLVTTDGRQLAEAVAAGTGARVRQLHRVDVPAIAVDPDAVTAAVLAAPYQRVVVTIGGDGAIDVIPYELD